jgi:transcriptional regulator with XRE-family HTH domain
MDMTNLILRSGKPRAKICAEAGISPAFLSLLESGQRKVGVKNVTSLASALGVSPADLRPDLAQHFGTISEERADCQHSGNGMRDA